MKHQNTRKLLSLLTACVMLFSLLCTTAFAAEVPAPYTADVTIATVDGEPFDTLEEAFVSAEENGSPAILISDYTLTSDLEVPADVELEIASDVMLTVPTSAAGNDTVTGNNISGNVASGSAYATLTIADGATVTVNGTLLVAGNQQSTQPKSGCLTGNYGAVTVAEGGVLAVNNGGKLYARGLIDGAGHVNIRNGGTAYQLFQIKDWRGGTKALAAYNADIFPFNLYEVSNIQAETKYENGSALVGQYYIYASSTHNIGEVPLIGAGSQLTFGDNTATNYIDMKKTADGSFEATINGYIKIDDIAVSLKQFGFDFAITSSYSVCPFGYNTDVVIANGGKMEITNDLKVLPGCEITVKNGGELVVDAGKSVNFYGANGYSSTYNYAGWTSTEAAKLTVENGGTITNSGTITSTDATFANVTGYTAAQNEDGTNTTVVVKEYVQASGAANVTFTVGTPVTSSVEE